MQDSYKGGGQRRNYDGTASGLFSSSFKDRFLSQCIKKIVEAVQDQDFIKICTNCGNSIIRKVVDSILLTGASVYRFGNAGKRGELMNNIPFHTTAMGNVDPAGQFRNGTS
ncbi:MAG: hypothetical protein JW901_00890 [Dehalococcoidia bacterium]|nr:hypothetical protein [Dehalococcoidia bacterium]